MEIPPIPPIICPHCGASNRPFVAQRCTNCKVNMISNSDFAKLTNEIKPLAAELRVKLQGIAAGTHGMKAIPEIQRLMKELAPYNDDFAWLQEYYHEINTKMASFFHQYEQYRRNLTLMYVILGVLGLIPLVAIFLGFPWIVVLLLVLPIPGWYVIGIKGYQKRFANLKA